MNPEPEIPLARVAAFVRQHTHDLRNGLNSLDLETAYLQEFVSDEEGRACLGRVRRQIRSLADHLRALSTNFQEALPVAAPLAARELFLIWQEKHLALDNPPEVQWIEELGEEKVTVDAEMMALIFRELLVNAAEFSPREKITLAARVRGEEVIFDMTEPKAQPVDPGTWEEPFWTTRRGGYGLGLWVAQRLIEAQGARISREYDRDARVLRTRLVFAAKR